MDELVKKRQGETSRGMSLCKGPEYTGTARPKDYRGSLTIEVEIETTKEKGKSRVLWI